MDQKPDPMLGRVLDGRYRIDRRVSRGGMAVVYEATDLRLDRVVAVKVMHEALADDPTFVDRFEREARSAAKLSHPNVVSVFDQGEDHGTLFLVMEYVPGVTLRDLIRREAPLPPATALRIIESVLAALQEAHGIGIVHRDIKPENVLLATADLTRMDPARTKVADFGLARAVNAETQHTATGGVIIGTVSYLAPEMLVHAASDARVDIYAVGVLLYELLTGEKPHQADNPIQVAYKHVHEDIGRPSGHVHGIPPYLDALVLRATTRDVDQRPQDAAVLVRHVRRVRQAIEAGVIDDPDLTADLLPGAHPDEEDTAASGIAGWSGYAPTSADDEMTAPLTAAASVSAPPRTPTPTRSVRTPPPVQRSRFRRRRLVFLLLILALLAGLITGGYYLVAGGRHTTVPVVVGLRMDAAEAALTKADLKPSIAKQWSWTVAKDHVISSDPGRGDEVDKQSSVTLIVSLGTPRVPGGLKGLTQAEATSALKAVDLTVSKVEETYNDKIEAGHVIKSSPTGGAKLPTESYAVVLTVSKGKFPITIPNVTGMSLADARAQAKKDKVSVVKGKSAFSFTVAKGLIIKQTPQSGTDGHHGDTITVVISKGPKMGTIPSGLVRMSPTAAKAALQEAGFTNIKISYPFGTELFHQVYGVNPPSGSRQRLDTEITLTVV